MQNLRKDNFLVLLSRVLLRFAVYKSRKNIRNKQQKGTNSNRVAFSKHEGCEGLAFFWWPSRVFPKSIEDPLSTGELPRDSPFEFHPGVGVRASASERLRRTERLFQLSSRPSAVRKASAKSETHFFLPIFSVLPKICANLVSCPRDNVPWPYLAGVTHLSDSSVKSANRIPSKWGKSEDNGLQKAISRGRSAFSYCCQVSQKTSLAFFLYSTKDRGVVEAFHCLFFTEEQFSPSAFNNRGSFGLRSFYTSDMKGKPALWGLAWSFRRKRSLAMCIKTP